MNTQIYSSLESDGILLATIDMPGRSMNVFSVELMDALEALMTRVESDPAVRSVVLTSGKTSFLAGADLVMVRGYTESAHTLNADQMVELCGRLGRQFVRLEASVKPWVAAVNGTALGGGLELAMACRARLVSDNPRSLLGLPEARWGLLPGAGGTQRLPRLVGFEAGLELLLSARAMNPKEAIERGVFERAVPADRLLDEARALARRLQGESFNPASKFAHLAQEDVPIHTPETVQALARRFGVSDADFRDYPAYETIIDCVLLGARQPLAEASAIEMRQFLRLMFNPVAGNMVRTLFLSRQRADRELEAPWDLRITHVTLGPLSPEHGLWEQALAKSRLPLHNDMSLPPGAMIITDSRGASHDIRIGTLSTEPPKGNSSTAQALLTSPAANGCVLEILTATQPTAQALAALAVRLGGALPYRSGDGFSVLQRLARAGRESPDAQSLEALRLLVSGAATQADTLDVVACAADLSPSWTGGPLTYLWTHRTRLEPQFDNILRTAWPRVEPLLRAACS
ncbi:enoyl-CoA hydratase-related protein [Rhodoferax ferrireducens]|uniref:enoyl-CoA hydratase-related protein n=1 Tax=Rhodoferax ferrireducens TaxID=192843 RepID=UPI000E0D21C8|nr:enoyl-CoA hydratase-related protein [Rhodoferax ferrireducens]